MHGIVVESLTVRFATEAGEVHALDDVNLQIGKGEFVCLLGPSGCGKTTLLNAIAGFQRPSAGRVLVDGAPVEGPSGRFGIVFQDFAQLFPWLTALRNVAFGLEVKGVPAGECVSTARRYLALVGLEGFADQYPHRLSGGMKQRVAIARALAIEPSVLLMDEPFGALDALTREELQRLLVDIWQQTRKTVVFVTHSVSEATFMADWIAVMSARPGRVSRTIPVDVSRPRDPRDPDLVEIQREIVALMSSRNGSSPNTRQRP